jgi:hypothetical protein
MGMDGEGRGMGEEGRQLTQAEPKRKPDLRPLVRRVHGQGNGAERAEEGIIVSALVCTSSSRLKPEISISFVLERK